MIDSFRRALAVTVVLTVVFVASAAVAGGFGPPFPGLALAALNTLPLLWLHRNPLAVVLVLCVAYPLWIATGHEPHLFQSLPALVVLYATGTWSRPLWLRAVALVAPVWMLVAVLVGLWEDVKLADVGYVAVMLALVWTLGVLVAARRSYVTQLEEKTTALEAARRELADRAATW